MTVQLLTPYSDPECHNTQRYRWRDKWHCDAKPVIPSAVWLAKTYI